MMPSRSTPNLQPQYHHHQARDADSPPPAPPVRDSSSLKSIKYGPGHEKFPSWPVPAAADTPPNLRGPPGGGSHRSKSWTDHTNYPKEKVVTYTRPYMKRQHSTYAQQKLKTVMERCEKIPPETYDSRYHHPNKPIYLPHLDLDGKPLGDINYTSPSPPERDITSYKYNQAHLTKSGLAEFMEYTNRTHYPSTEEIATAEDPNHHHQKQLSYAQSEGYHSYVSSTDSTSTPFLDRLRRDSEAQHPSTWTEDSSTFTAILTQQQQQNGRREGRDSVVTTTSSGSSSETLKWHGSMSDVSSVASSSSTTHLNSSSTSVSKQLIAHSARVQTPQRHHSESVLYMSGIDNNSNPESWKERESRNNNTNKLKLFPVNTYTVPDHHSTRLSNVSAALSVADRISELEKQQKYSYLDPEKKHKIPDPTLKAIQKKALLSFYERHRENPNRNNTWRSEPQLSHQKQPPPPPRVKIQLPSRRASSASDYSPKRNSLATSPCKDTTNHHHHTNSCGSLSTDLLGPIIVGPSISVDDFIPDQPPARPPKNPHLRTAFPDLFSDQRVPSPDLPPPSPPPILEDEVFNNDDPLPPPPPECETDWQQEFNDRLKENTTNQQFASPQTPKQTIGLPDRYSGVRSSIKTRPGGHIIQQVSSRPYNVKPDQILGFPNQQAYAERSSARYPAKFCGNIAVSQKICHGFSEQFRAEPLVKKEDASKRASISEAPPPLQPRQTRLNQSMRGRISHPPPAARQSPLKEERMRETRSQSLSQSKASYLASRRDRDRIVPDSDTGSYKRTMSPNGRPDPTPPKDWTNNHHNTILMRRSSMNEKPEEPIVLPDVLPINAKILQNRSQPSIDSKKSPPTSPSHLVKNRGSPFTPLRTTNLSNPPLLASCINSSYIRSTPPKTINTSSSTTTTSFNKRLSPPQIKASLSPPLKFSSSSSSSSSSPISSSSGSSPLQISPLSSPPQSPKRLDSSPGDCPKVIEGLQLIQRTEVVLRVNTSTTDAASQTEKDELPPTPLPSRKKLQEEIECEKLSEDFVNHLPTSDRLKELLVPGPDHKKPTDYVHGLFRVEVTSRPRPTNSPFRSRNTTPSSSPPPLTTATNKFSSPTSEPTSPLSGSSTYFTISEPKAKFLTRFSQDMDQCHVVKDTKDLSIKKEELVTRLDRKLQVLRSEQLVVFEECKINDELGDNVEAHIRRLARPHEADKFRLHIEEVGKITSLLLGLSGRLARAENALMGMPEDHPDRRILESKRDKLLEQLEEAKKLKECIDRRSVNVSNILYKYLNTEEYTDYDHFINMKAKLIMDSKEIADKIKLGEEQLVALKETLIVAD